MGFLKIFALVFALLAIAFSGFAVKMLFKKNAEFKGGTCSTINESGNKDFSCGCGGGNCSN